MSSDFWLRCVCALALAPVAFASVHAQTSGKGTCACDTAVKSTAEDRKLQAIYNAEWVWRQHMRGEEDDDSETQPHIRPNLPKVDAGTQAERLRYWTDVLKRLGALDAGKLSEGERLNLAVYRAQIQVLVNAQRFREYERPVNSDTAFWSSLTMDADDLSAFRTAVDYENDLAQLRDIPRYFDEEIANMRAGVGRGFTPPRATLAGRDATIMPVANATDPAATPFYKPFVTMPASIPADVQAKLRGEALQVIRTAVIPAYRHLLRFWNEEYVPHAVVSLAAEDLPDGTAYYESKILEYGTVELTPEQIHALGLAEMAKIHAEMLATIREAKFDGDLAGVLAVPAHRSAVLCKDA